MIGEDSGLQVDALGGGPGLHSARWAGDEDPIDRLLRELDGVDEREGRYVCELVAIAPDDTERRGTGRLEGRIARERRGSEGFGYDPVFVPDGRGAHRRGARRRLEGGELAPSARGSGARSVSRRVCVGRVQGLTRSRPSAWLAHGSQAGWRPSSSAGPAPARNQFTSAPKTITFAIT